MLTYDDNPTIRTAIRRRLGREPGLEIIDIEIKNQPKAVPAHIQVAIWWMWRDRVQDTGMIDGRSFFDLPAEFTHRHLINEIDEITEQAKEIKRKTKVGRVVWQAGIAQPRETVKGTGFRGRWPG